MTTSLCSPVPIPWWYCTPPEATPVPPVRPTGFVLFADYDVDFKYPLASSRVFAPTKMAAIEEGCSGCAPTLIETPEQPDTCPECPDCPDPIICPDPEECPECPDCPDCPAEVVSTLFIAPDNQASLRVSLTDTFSFNTVATGATATSETLVDTFPGGIVVHWSTGNMRVSFDSGADGTFVAVPGLPTSFSPNPTKLLYTGTEYLALGGTIWASPDLISPFVLRTDTVAAIKAMKRGSTIVGIHGGRLLGLSTDNGATWGTYSLGTTLNSFESIQAIEDTGTYFVIAANNPSTQLIIGRSLTGLDGSWTWTAGPATTLAHGLRKDASGNLLLVLSSGAVWISSNHGASWTAAPSLTYAWPPTYPPTQWNKLAFYDGAFYFGAAQGAGINHVYRWEVGDPAWELIYTGPSGSSLDSIAGLL